MEENELEEGEAYSGQEDDIDPDTLSYIDEKLKDVLGHLQKEFEGGVSAETLGAKFGGYGSFLPAYQRSPSVLTQSKSPVKVKPHNASRSPCNLQPEFVYQNAAAPATQSIAKPNAASTSQTSERTVKWGNCISTSKTEDINQHEVIFKSESIGDHRSLKVRIKVGAGNVLPRNNPDIYSDLGLDVSASPSLEDSPGGSRELSCESPHTLCESPATILQTMTCFSVLGGSLLSPLSPSILHLSEKEDSFLKNSMSCMLHKIMSGSCVASSITPWNTKNGRDFTNKENNYRGSVLAAVQTCGQTWEVVKSTSLMNNVETPVAQEVVSSVQDMPLPSIVSCVDAKAEGNVFGDSMKGIKSKDLEFIGCMRTEEEVHSEKETGYPNGKPYYKDHVAEKEFVDSGANGQDITFATHKKNKSRAKKNKFKADSSGHRPRKDCNAENMEFAKEITAQKSFSTEKSVSKTVQGRGEACVSGRMLKLSENNGIPFIESNKEQLSAALSVAHKSKNKLSDVYSLCSERKSKPSKLQKGINKVHNVEPQRDFAVIPHVQQVESTALVVGSISTEREGSQGSRAVKFGIAGPPTDAPPSMSDAAPSSDAATATQSLVLIQDNWVCCDECQRWRLLPCGTNPEDLPKKWRCSMQFWLPGLNNCKISEDETTKAFHELYPVPVPVSDTNLTSHLDAAASTVTSAGPFNPARRLENNTNDGPLSRNKKHASMDGIDLTTDSSLTQLPKPSRNLQVAFQDKCLNDVGYCLETDSKLMPSYKDGGAAEKHLYKPTEKHKFMSSYKEGGKAKHSKPMCKREADVYGHSSSKKCKKDNSCLSLKDLHSVLGTTGKIAANKDSNLDKALKNVSQSYSDHSSSKNFMSKSASSKKSIDAVTSSSHRKHGELCSSSHAEKSDKYDSNCKKRKLKEWQEKHACKKISMRGQLSVGTSPKIKEHLVPNELRRQKKAKIAKYEEKGSHAAIGSGKIETRNIISNNKKHLLDNGCVQSTTEEQLLHYQGNAMLGQDLDCMDGVKRNVKYAHPLAAAAASSSSKVSGSQKSKKTLPDLRESPVESVSSSPMRVIKTENNSTRRNSSMKDDVVRSEIGCQRGLSDGEVYVNGVQSGTKINDPASFAKSSEVYKSAESGARKSLKDPYDYMGAETNALAVVSNIGNKLTKHHDVVSSNLHETSIFFDDVNSSPQSKKCQLMQLDKNHASDEVKHCASGQKKTGKGFLYSRDKQGILDKDTDGGNLKVFGSSKHKELHSFQSTIHKADMEFDLLNSNRKCDLESHCKYQIVNDLSSAIAGQKKSTPEENLQQEPSNGKQKPPDLLISVEFDRSVVDSGKGMQPFHSVKDGLRKKGPVPQKVPESIKGTSLEQYHVDAVKSMALKSSKLSRKIDGLNGMHPNLDLQPIPSVPGSSPTKKDGHSSVNALIKEARDLKHTATRLKNDGFIVESSDLFFESALKFLHAASHMEPANVENARQGDLVPSSQMLLMYYETAKFFEFCAHEFEKLKQMAATSLAYKCTEVAYWKVAYYKQPSASKDHAELQVALDAAFPGESSSSSASDVDNLNNQGGFDKASSVKAVGSPQVASSLAIAARNRPHIIRLLTYTNHLNCAFEASKKSQNAIAIASTELGKSSIDAVCSVREVLDFNFHNVEGLLRLVRQSMNSISRL